MQNPTQSQKTGNVIISNFVHSGNNNSITKKVVGALKIIE